MVEVGALERMEAVACQNIGPKEKQHRINTGYFGAVLSVITAAALVALHASWQWRLLMMLPAGISAFGFFQAQANVCVAFAAANIKVLGDSRKDLIRVTDGVEKAAFQAAARRIYAKGIAAAAAVTALVMLLP